jgi:hypothetical protein
LAQVALDQLSALVVPVRAPVLVVLGLNLAVQE